jgi:DNA-binding NtrC family response regulator
VPPDNHSTTERKSILVVDDDIDLRDLYSEFLVSEGFEVMGVGSAEKALDIFALKKKIDLVILDLTLPGMSPSEFIDQKNLLPHFASTPVVTISGCADIATQSREIGATDFLSKPFDLDQFAHKVKAWTKIN